MAMKRTMVCFLINKIGKSHFIYEKNIIFQKFDLIEHDKNVNYIYLQLLECLLCPTILK